MNWIRVKWNEWHDVISLDALNFKEITRRNLTSAGALTCNSGSGKKKKKCAPGPRFQKQQQQQQQQQPCKSAALWGTDKRGNEFLSFCLKSHLWRLGDVSKITPKKCTGCWNVSFRPDRYATTWHSRFIIFFKNSFQTLNVLFDSFFFRWGNFASSRLICFNESERRWSRRWLRLKGMENVVSQCSI